MNRIGWINPSTIEAAVAALSEPGAALKAGGVDLIDLLKERLIAPERLVNLRSIAGLDRIATRDDGSLAIGALCTLAQLAAAPELDGDAYRALALACGHAATPQIRNMATVAGNLLQRPRCWYFRSEHFRCRKKGGAICYAQHGENAYHAVIGNQACAAVHPSAAAVALLALDARVEIHGANGARSLALSELFVTPEVDILREHALETGEIITAIVLPKATAGRRTAYLKQGEKASYDWPLAEVAVALELDAAGVCSKATVILGHAAPVPLRSGAAEAALGGKRIDEASARAAANAAMLLATPLEQNRYKVSIFKAIIRRTILAAAGASP